MAIALSVFIGLGVLGASFALASTGLGTTLSCSPSPAQPGSLITCQFSVNNQGDTNASLTTITRQFPCVGALCTGLGSGAPTDIRASLTACSPGSTNTVLAPNGSCAGQFTFNIPLETNQCGTSPKVGVSAFATYPDQPGTEASSAPTFTIPIVCPDIKVEKTAANATINAGDVAQFNIVVTNLGPGTATAVTLTDNLPAVTNGWTLGGPDAASCGIVANVLSCTFGDLAALATKTINVSTTTVAADCKSLPNTATVAATNEDQTKLANNASSATIVVNCPNVKIEKSGNGPLAAGGTATFTITVTNLGPGTATNVKVADTLAGTGWTDDSADCTVTPGANDALACTFASIGFPGSVVVHVSRTTTAQDCPKIDNTATVTATGDTNQNDNSASASIVVNCGDVKIEKSGNGPLTAGQTATWTILVTNNGPTTATNVKVADTLPGTGWTDDSADCTVTPGVNDVLNCTIPSLVFPGAATVHVSRATKAADCPKIDNTATVTADVDTDAANNSASASIAVTCGDVKIVKTGNGPLNVGDTATWTIVVTNNGPTTATNVKVADTLPGTGWTDDSADCTVTPGVNDVLNCTIPSLVFPGSATVHVSRATKATDCPKLDNTATVTADVDTDAANNSSSASIQVNCADVKIEKSGNGPINATQVATFTITVTNLGPGTATNVFVADTLPGTGWTDDSADCTVTPGVNDVLNCELPTLGFPGSAVVHVSKTTTKADCPQLNNTATVTATGDTNAANNSASASIVVNCPETTIQTQSTPNAIVAAGTPAKDTATLSGSNPAPTGTITFFLCQPATVTANGGNCSAGGTQVGAPVAIVGGTATSASTAPADTQATGKYCWRTVYSGDALYAPVTHTNGTTECFTVRTLPDLTVTKELKPGQPAFNVSGRIYYLVHIKNVGGSATPPPPDSVTLIDTPPTGTSVAAWSIIKGSGRCAIDGAGRLVCDLGASMAAGAEYIVEVVVRLPATKVGEYTNRAEVDPFNRIPESDETNNKTSLVTIVPPVAP
ncbi:MAG: CARDB domain-containing protein [Dehalococcoidia bacterium]